MVMQKSRKKRSGRPSGDNSPNGGPSTSQSHQNQVDDDRENHNQTLNGDANHISDDEEGGMRIGDIYIPPAPTPAMSIDSTGPRLIITKITNENFKSYAGEQHLGPFHKSFNSIIGPNGSGKSNVIDSMLFVFGYRATKIRSKKISVLIHSSSKFPNLKSASVAVHFCKIIDGEGEDFTVVPGSEIVVSRTAFRDSSSFYCLNGRRVQFKEVARVLRSNGIDLDHNRFLILQGEVEQIAMMKPKATNEHETGMLEYLEDIIGSSRYKEPIIKLGEQVEDLCDLRKEKLNRVRLVEQEKIKLEQPMKEAIDLVNLTNTALRTRNLLLQKYILQSSKAYESKQRELANLKQNLADIDEKLKRIENEVNEKSGVLKEGSKKYVTLRKQKEGTAEKLQVCKRKTVTTQADLTQRNKKKSNLDQLLEQEKGTLIELEMIPEKNQREIDDCQKLIVKHTEQKVKLETELQTTIASVRSKTQGLQETKDRLVENLMDLKRIVDESNNHCKLSESELKLYLSTEQKEGEKLQKMKIDCAKAEADLYEKKPLQVELSKTVPANEAKLHEANIKLQHLKKEEGKLMSDVRPLRAQLEESRQAMSANTSRDRVLDAIMTEKRSGRMPGIFGRLGDLGGIDAKYDVAISTCCGALDHIVVDTVETAQLCVEHLKRYDIGRATFLALDKQEHLREKYERRSTYPEDVPRLFDLVNVRDQRVLPAFYFALRDTLVANDLEQASRIAYGQTRYRVVTLKGDLIEIAGTMSGGGRTTMRGRMASSVPQDTREHDPVAVKANEEKLLKMEKRLTEIREEQSELEEAIGVLQRTVRDGKITLSKLNIEIKSLVEQVPAMKNQVKRQETRAAASRADPEQKANLQAALATAQLQLEKAKEDASKVEAEVQRVDTQISAVTGGKVRDLQKAVNDITKKIDKIYSEITKLKVAINTSKRNAKKAQDKIQQMEADLTETEKTIEKLNNQKKDLTLESTKLQREFEELEEKVNEGNGEFSELKQEIQRLQTQENKVKAKRLEANNEIVQMEKAIVECTAKVPGWRAELRKMKLEDPGVENVPGMDPLDPFKVYTTDELEDIATDEVKHRLTAQKNRIGDEVPNIQAILDYKTKEDLYLRRAAELDEITTKRNERRAVCDELKRKRNTEFMTGFTIIMSKLKEMYRMITVGGDAELELVDSMDPFTEGIAFSVRPLNKSWKTITNLSGGEKTLSSLALVFALHFYKPTPLYVMDEIDAALDFKNVSIVANYVKERTKNAQFVIISLRYNMFEVSHRLIGIYKTQDCTKSIAIDNKVPPEHNLEGGDVVEAQ